MSKKSVLISTYHHNELKKLAEAFGLSYYKFIEESISYFKKTGINPKEPNNENPSKALKELDKRMVSFLKVQERDILKPLRQEVYNYSKEHSQEVQKIQKNLINALNSLNQNEIKRAHSLLLEITKQRKALLTIAQLIDAKNKSGFVNKIKNIID